MLPDHSNPATLPPRIAETESALEAARKRQVALHSSCSSLRQRAHTLAARSRELQLAARCDLALLVSAIIGALLALGTGLVAYIAATEAFVHHPSSADPSFCLGGAVLGVLALLSLLIGRRGHIERPRRILRRITWIGAAASIVSLVLTLAVVTSRSHSDAIQGSVSLPLKRCGSVQRPPGTSPAASCHRATDGGTTCWT